MTMTAISTDETLVSFGGSVKALDDKGKIGGYLVLFGSADQTDASSLRDYFTKDTDFGLDVMAKTRVLYAHGLDPTLKDRKLAIGDLKAQDVGVWLEGQLNLRDEYEKKIFGMVKDGKLGFSSGTAAHLIRRETQANGSNKILTWPLGLDASLTPCPAEPRTQAVALKSLAFEGIKGEHLGPYSEHEATMSAVASIHRNLSGATSMALGDQKLDNPQKLKKIKAAHDEARDSALKIVGAMLPCPPTSVGSSNATLEVTKSLDLDLIEAEFLCLDGLLDGLL